MAVIVVGGGERGVGKTALICGLLRALPERLWTAVKVTTHGHGLPDAIHEEREPARGSEQGTDTGRYLAAGARRALLVTASEDALGPIARKIVAECPSKENVIFESNSVLRYVQPDLCLAVYPNLKGAHKPSFDLVEECMDASVALAGHDHLIDGVKLHFHLRSLDRISPPMRAWLHERLSDRKP